MTTLLPIPSHPAHYTKTARWTAGSTNRVATGSGEVPAIILADNWGEGEPVIVQFQRDDTDLGVLAGDVATINALCLLEG